MKIKTSEVTVLWTQLCPRVCVTSTILHKMKVHNHFSQISVLTCRIDDDWSSYQPVPLRLATSCCSTTLTVTITPPPPQPPPFTSPQEMWAASDTLRPATAKLSHYEASSVIPTARSFLFVCFAVGSRHTDVYSKFIHSLFFTLSEETRQKFTILRLRDVGRTLIPKQVWTCNLLSPKSTVLTSGLSPMGDGEQTRSMLVVWLQPSLLLKSTGCIL